MKLATYKDGSRDGQLVVVSRDLTTAHYATSIATRLQQVLDDWNFLSPQLQDLYVTLNQGRARHAFPFDPAMCMAPLPRPVQAYDAWASPGHLERLGLPVPPKAEGPIVTTVAGANLGPTDPLVPPLAGEALDLGAGLAVMTGDLSAGCSPSEALESVRLLTLANTWTLPEVLRAERERAWGLLHARPATSYGPVALTPDELGEAWQRGRVHLPLLVQAQGRRLGRFDAAPAMGWHVGRWLAQAARTRSLPAGTVVHSGPLGLSAGDGMACLAEKRAQESRAHGEPRSAWLLGGDRVHIELQADDGAPLMGAIDAEVLAQG
ncbi:fumarylacetoacetate hydrolase family protein [Caldimonas caldifontis]|uniref:Fumarylacetoacetate hydrolase n=1 Tax=Caldimonas caldifontis TaxID=1452508 RepID=A0A2S5SW79_9BURK|nr:fumarylacetoacetate hydrolase family protein [Caldimonas caldifontis]PPE66827.1 fumarylacetoacetate hydrolase [Caldimonas caldifontis]